MVRKLFESFARRITDERKKNQNIEDNFLENQKKKFNSHQLTIEDINAYEKLSKNRTFERGKLAEFNEKLLKTDFIQGAKKLALEVPVAGRIAITILDRALPWSYRFSRREELLYKMRHIFIHSAKKPSLRKEITFDFINMMWENEKHKKSPYYDPKLQKEIYNFFDARAEIEKWNKFRKYKKTQPGQQFLKALTRELMFDYKFMEKHHTDRDFEVIAMGLGGKWESKEGLFDSIRNDPNRKQLKNIIRFFNTSYEHLSELKMKKKILLKKNAFKNKEFKKKYDEVKFRMYATIIMEQVLIRKTMGEPIFHREGRKFFNDMKKSFETTPNEFSDNNLRKFSLNIREEYNDMQSPEYKKKLTEEEQQRVSEVTNFVRDYLNKFA